MQNATHAKHFFCVYSRVDSFLSFDENNAKCDWHENSNTCRQWKTLNYHNLLPAINERRNKFAHSTCTTFSRHKREQVYIWYVRMMENVLEWSSISANIIKLKYWIKKEETLARHLSLTTFFFWSEKTIEKDKQKQPWTICTHRICIA